MGVVDGKCEVGKAKGRAASAEARPPAASAGERRGDRRRRARSMRANGIRWERGDFAILNSEPLPVNDWGIWTELPSRWIKPRWE